VRLDSKLDSYVGYQTSKVGFVRSSIVIVRRDRQKVHILDINCDCNHAFATCFTVIIKLFLALCIVYSTHQQTRNSLTVINSGHGPQMSV
jgi:hypothetical protein